MKEMFKYLPIDSEYSSGDLTIKRLKICQDLSAEFINLVTKIISLDYDEITTNFATRIVEIDLKDEDEWGFFSLGKEVWVLFLKETFVGFEVITRKRGGSIKIGPTIILEKYQRQGLALRYIELILKIYKAYGARKVYLTAPVSNFPTALLDFNKLNLRLEAVLDQYYSSENERIVGKLFYQSDRKEKLVITEHDNNKSIHEIIRISSLDQLDTTKSSYIISMMSKYYDDIDSRFMSSIFKPEQEQNGHIDYERKYKTLYITLNESKRICGFFVLTPKRGGGLKINPIFLDDGYKNLGNINKILEYFELVFDEFNRNKILVSIPVIEWQLFNLLLMHEFKFCGRLIEPYKIGIDFLLLLKRK